MNKKEFIEFLNEKCKLNDNGWHWERTYSNSDDDWSYRKQSVDCVEDDMDLATEGMVKITYGKDLYAPLFGKPFSKNITMTYDEFVESYKKKYEYEQKIVP